MNCKKAMIAVMACFCLLAPTFLLAAGVDPETPATLKDVKIITAAEAKKLFDQKEALFVDTRSAMNFGKGHIPGAKLVVYKGNSENKADFDGSADEFALSELPADKNAKIVIYGHGTTGWKAYKACVKVSKAGYTNLMYFRSGLEDWEKNGYPKE